MKKKFFERGFWGFFVGLAIEPLLTIFVSLLLGKGDYMIVKPEFAEAMGGELNAVILQTALYGIYGICIGIAGLALGYGKWSIAKQTGIYVAIFGAGWFPVLFVCRWIPHSVSGALAFFGGLAGVYVLLWAMLYISWKINIRKMNKCIQKNSETK